MNDMLTRQVLTPFRLQAEAIDAKIFDLQELAQETFWLVIKEEFGENYPYDREEAESVVYADGRVGEIEAEIRLQKDLLRKVNIATGVARDFFQPGWRIPPF